MDNLEDVEHDESIRYEDFVNIVETDLAVCGELWGVEIVTEVMNKRNEAESSDNEGDQPDSPNIPVPMAS